jgi:hypothetical protein
MQISKDEALLLAFSLDVAITVLEWESDPHAKPPGLTARAADEALIHLRQVRSAALRANREFDAAPATPADIEGQLRKSL